MEYWRNGSGNDDLLKLVESLERKKEAGDWIDHLVLKESNVIYSTEPEQVAIS